MIHSGYINSKVDYPLFTKKICAKIIIIQVYVDDLFLRGTDFDDITNTKTLWIDKFDIKDFGVLKYFLRFWATQILP